MEKFKRVELYDTFTIDHQITGEVSEFKQWKETM